jgi:carbon-monoxide dehydrogenase small subunit
MLLAAHVILQHTAQPSADDVREGLAGNLCRCTGYTKIIDAVLACTK